MDTCFYCGSLATHFCPGCGKNLCDGAACRAKAATSAIRHNPAAAIAAAPAALGRAVGSVADAAAKALGFKP
jgi:hypothetical protein